VKIELVDQSNVEKLTRLAFKRGPFDIIIEDGSHMWGHQITSLRTLFPFLKDGGLYIAEDLQTNYGSMQDTYKGVSSLSCMEHLKSWVDLRVADDQLPINDVEDAFLLYLWSRSPVNHFLSTGLPCQEIPSACDSGRRRWSTNQFSVAG